MTRKIAVNIGSTGNRLSALFFQKLAVEHGWKAIPRDNIDWENPDEYPLETIQLREEYFDREHEHPFRFFFPHSQDKEIEIREHPDVITVLEELGEAAAQRSRKADKIAIAEIPESIEVDVRENERGFEWLAEKHQTWSSQHPNAETLEDMD